MKIINLIRQVFGKPKKFFPVLNEQGFADKPKKFFSAEVKYLLEQRRKGIFGNGTCADSDF